MKTIQVIVHSIAKDGLPPRGDHFDGRVAFIWDGSLYSGWPLYDGPNFDGPDCHVAALGNASRARLKIIREAAVKRAEIIAGEKATT